ncbi:adenosylmethionine--8-amino-7-oxononanoate transaminase [Ramlibacter aurantiacus]|uniref:adenosylmethionine--8-amino-7-oxononanoate transaminase n=1 Tax=Ramlibacter aurantiacus TaxID=2801330 RepID=UPI001F164535|nr:adenosylmethionine--8-amino-7-oxononanoate transaminase [Ramlibacter aurantiacus]
MSQSLPTDLASRSLRAVWHPCTQMQHHDEVPPLALASGQGAWLLDTDGRRYLDAVSSWWVNLLGHAHPRINDAIKQQLDTLEHAMLAGFTHQPAVELAERLSALTGHALGHAFYASDGASAIEIALKMSHHCWRNQGLPGKQRFVGFERGYHGETLGALAVTDIALFRRAYEPLLRSAQLLPSPDERLAAPHEDAAAPARRALAALDELLQRESHAISAVVVEPLVQCAGGMAMHGPEFIARLAALCEAHQVHLIADEIAVGCGRTGSFFACEQAGVWPHMLCLSKGISAGYLPLAVVLSRPAIYQAFHHPDLERGFLHSHSYSGNPLACRAALAMLDVMESERVLERNRRLAQSLTAALQPLARHPRVRHFRQRGMIWAFDAGIDDPAQRATFARRTSQLALQQGLLLRPIGTTVYLMPPYVLDDDEVGLLAERTVRVFDAAVGS